MIKQVLFSLLTIAALSACDHNSDDDPTPSTDPTPTLTEGTWRVSYFFDKDKVETDDFTGYTFEFRDNGEFLAIRGGTTTTGTWAVRDSNRKLDISIVGNNPLDELTDDWIIISKTDDLIKLKDDNDEHLEELHFAKTN